MEANKEEEDEDDDEEEAEEADDEEEGKFMRFFIYWNKMNWVECFGLLLGDEKTEAEEDEDEENSVTNEEQSELELLGETLGLTRSEKH